MTIGDGLASLGVSILISALFAVDAWLFSKGYSSFFHKAKTDVEKEIQQAVVDNLKKGR